jgi:hypothetical protein
MLGKALGALLAAGVVAVVAGKGTLAAVLLVLGAVGAAVGVVADAHLKALERRHARNAAQDEQQAVAAARQRAIDAALRTEPCAVADVRAELIGVDPVDPRVLEQAFCVDGDQLAYVSRSIDEDLRAHLVRARDRVGPALVCLYGPSKAGKSRSMLQALKAELPDAMLVAPDRTRANLQTIIDGGVLEQVGAVAGSGVVLWLDDLEGFVRLGNSGLDAKSLRALKRQVPSLVVAATAGGRGLAHAEQERTQLQQPLTDLLAHGAREHLLASLTTPAEREALADVVPKELTQEMQDGLGAVAVAGDELVDILVSERHPRANRGEPCPEGAALTWAAIAAFRLGMTDPIADDVLRRLFACYTTARSDETFNAALRWETTPLYGTCRCYDPTAPRLLLMTISSNTPHTGTPTPSAAHGPSCSTAVPLTGSFS